MTTLDQPNKLAAQPRNPFRWLVRWLTWAHKQDRAKSIPFEKEVDRENRLASQRANAYHLVDRIAR